MSNDKEILINDSCILFDLIDLNLIVDFFQLDYTVFTTQMVIGEITDNIQLSAISKFIASGRLIVDSEDSFESIHLLFEKLPGLSYSDCSVLELAMRKKGIVLSSDKGLRNESQRRNLIVRGMLWIIEALIKRGIITVETGIEKLKNFPGINQRVPKHEIAILINKLEQQLT